MILTTVNVDVSDDWVETKNTELDGLMIRGNKLTIWEYEFPFGLIKQSTKEDVSLLFSFFHLPFLKKASYII